MDAAYLSAVPPAALCGCSTCATIGTGWDPKGPASVHICKAALELRPATSSATHFESRGFSRVDVDTNESDPRDTLPGQLLGLGQHHDAGLRLCRQEDLHLSQRRLHRVGDGGAAGDRTPRRCAPRICAIRWDRRPTSRARASSTNSPPPPRPTRWSSACATCTRAARRRGDPVPRPTGSAGQPRPAFAKGPSQSGDVVRGRGMALAQRVGHACGRRRSMIEVDRNTGDGAPGPLGGRA